TRGPPPLAALNEMSVTAFGVRADEDRGAAAVRLTTKSGSNAWSGSASFSRRGDQLSALPATFERGGAAPSFDRAQFSGAIGGPIAKDRAFWFGSFEHLRQRSLLQAGERDPRPHPIRNKLSAIPLASTRGLLRADWRVSDRGQLAILYAAERSEGDDLPALQRALASASQRQRFNEEFDQGLLHYTRVISPTLVAEARLGFSGLRAPSAAAANGLHLDFPDFPPRRPVPRPRAAAPQSFATGGRPRQSRGNSHVQIGS